MDFSEMNFKTDTDGAVQNPSGIIQIKKTDSDESIAEVEIFLFDLNCDGESYSVRLKDMSYRPYSVTIPAMHKELPVTKVAENGFLQLTSLSVVLFEEPSNIQTIGCDAFAGCNKLESITLPESIVSLNAGAFRGCSLLQQVYFQSECPPLLGENVFEETSPLLNLYVPACSYCRYMGAECWREYRDLILLSPEQLPSDLGFFSFHLTEKGDSYTVSQGGMGVPSYLAIPQRYNRKPVKIIGDSAFSYFHIKELFIPDTIEKIGKYAFNASNYHRFPGYIYSESQLESVVFGKKSSLIRIGESAFLGNLKLTSIKLPKSLRELDVNAFSSCGFRFFEIPRNVETISHSVFSLCLQLDRISVDKRNAS